MDKPRQLHVETLQEPFALLKVCQTLREIPEGGSLELLIEGESIPHALRKILPPQHYQIAMQKSAAKTARLKVIIKKTKLSTLESSVSSDNNRCRR